MNIEMTKKKQSTNNGLKSKAGVQFVDLLKHFTNPHVIVFGILIDHNFR